MLWRVRSPATIETIPYRKIHVNSFCKNFRFLGLLYGRQIMLFPYHAFKFVLHVT